MTEAFQPAMYLEGDFRVGHVLNRTWTVFSRNFAMFCLVTAIASMPGLLLFEPTRTGRTMTATDLGWFFGGLLAAAIFNTLSEAIVLFGAFQDMRGRPMNLAESAQIGLRRFLPLIGLAIVFYVLVTIGFALLIFPGLMLYTMWFVATPPCVVEQCGPFRSLGRSQQLTKGHRWKIFGLILLVGLIGLVGGGLVLGAAALAGPVLSFIINLIWNSVVRAFTAVLVVVTYHDLRVAKEGVDTDKIASVFD